MADTNQQPRINRETVDSQMEHSINEAPNLMSEYQATPQSITPEITKPAIEQVGETLPKPEVERKTEIEPSKESIEKKEEEGFLEDALEGIKSKLGRGKKKQVQIPQVRDEITLKVEKVMEEGLKEAFHAMTPVQRQEFKIKGEETAIKIRELLKSTHVKVKKIFTLLVEWLKMIPGVNRFFLEQEAKIKADKIISLKHFDKHSKK